MPQGHSPEDGDGAGDTMPAPQSFEGRIMSLLPDLRRYSRSLTRSDADGEDLLHDSVERVLSARATWSGTNLRGWVLAIMTNLHRNGTRRQRRFPSVDIDDADALPAAETLGDPLERLAAVVDVEVFRGPLTAALRRSGRSKGGRPPFDPVLMFKILVLQALYSLSDEATEFQIKDRLSFQRFLGLGLDGTVPDATTVWLFRERLVKAKAIERLFARFDAALTDRGYLAMGGQITDAAVVYGSGGRDDAGVVNSRHSIVAQRKGPAG